jgi:hypothetical protein
MLSIRKSLEKGKPNSAQVGPLSPAPARAHAPPMPNMRAPHVGANQRALSLSLAAPWARLVGVVLKG